MGIGTLLLDRGLISDIQLAEAIAEQQRTGERLDHVLVRLGFVRPHEVLEAIGQQFGMPIVDLTSIEVDESTLRMLPPKLVFKQRCVPIRRTGNALQIATCDPFELSAFDELQPPDRRADRARPRRGAGHLEVHPDPLRRRGRHARRARGRGRTPSPRPARRSVPPRSTGAGGERRPARQRPAARGDQASAPPTSTSSPTRTPSRSATASTACSPTRACRRR